MACNGEEALSLLGRLIFGGFFIYSGIHHFTEKRGMIQAVEQKHLPKPDAAVAATGIALIAGSASIVLGIKPKIGVSAIVGFLATVSPLMHDFWKHKDPNKRMNEIVNFTKNVALLGSALHFAGTEERETA